MKLSDLLSSTFVLLLCTHGLTQGQDAAKICDVIDQGTSFDPTEESDCEIFVLDPLFSSLLSDRGQDKSGIRLRHKITEKYFHEGPVLFDDALYFVSNRLGTDGENTKITWGQKSPTQLNQFVHVLKFDLETDELSILDTEPSIEMANGMTKTADGQNILVLSQGFNKTGGGIFELNRETLKVESVVTSFFGRQFNSPNDIEITSDGIIFFSDPAYGFEQGFRSNENPMLGSNVYRYDTKTKRLSPLTTFLARPNGVALFDDRKNGNGCILFLSDTGYSTAPFSATNPTNVQSPRGLDGVGDSALYTMRDDGDRCFAPMDGPWTLQPLTPAISGIQDGMQVHRSSELLFYCGGAGLWIWSIPLYQHIGFVKLEKGCTQVIFSQKSGVNDAFILAEKKLYEMTFNFGDGSSNDSSGSCGRTGGSQILNEVEQYHLKETR